MKTGKHISRISLLVGLASSNQFAFGQAEYCTPVSIPSGCSVALPAVQYDVFTIEDSVLKQRQIAGPWSTADACNCGYIPCSERADCPGVQRTSSWSLELCIEVGGELELELRSGLIEQLLVDVGATVTLTASASGCYTFGESTTWTLPRSHCFKMKYRTLQTEVTSSRKWRRVETLCTFTVHCPNQAPYATVTETGVKTGTGKLKSTSGISDQIAPFPAACGGPPDNPSDEYGGVRREPCAPGVCPPPPSPQTPGCGCYANN